MKTLNRFAFLFFMLILTHPLSAQIYVNDPESWGTTTTATIEEASLTIKPKGVYMEYGLYLTISAKGSYYDGDANPPLEIVMDFCLPENSIIHDSWLWVNNDIMQAVLVDRNVATQIYEGIVDRRRDPSILKKNMDGCYELRVYPLAGNSTRKLKITYLVPARWTRSWVSSPLPLDMLRMSNTIPDLNITIYTDTTFQNPLISELGFLPYINYSGSGVYTSKIPSSMISSYQDLELAYASPLQNGWFACNYPVGNSGGYYQLIFHPQQAMQITRPRKVGLLVEYTAGNSDVQQTELFAKLKEMLNEYFLPTDSFNVFFTSSGTVQRLSTNWLPATPVSIQSAFAVVPANWQSAIRTSDLITNALNFIHTNGNDGEVLLISNNNSYISTSSANLMVSNLVQGTASNIPIHVLNYAGRGDYYYSGSYTQMDYLYENLTSQTGGNYVRHQFKEYRQLDWSWEWDYYYYYERPVTTVSDLMHEMFSSFDAPPQNYSLLAEPDTGFCYAEIELPGSNLAGGSRQFVGKYYGSGALNVEYRGLQNGSIVTINTQLHSYTGDSLTRKIWAGCHISEMENTMQTSVTRKTIVDTSMDNRVLSLYTAFLALEPNDTLEACENCADDSGENNGGNSVGVASVSSDLAKVEIAPNPFSNTTTITISTDGNALSGAELKIYNMIGQEVKEFKNLFAVAHESITLTWDGEDNSGNSLPDGIYMVVLTSQSGKQIVKLMKAS